MKALLAFLLGLWRDEYGGGGENTSTQTNEPWAAQQPYLKTGFQGAQSGVLNRPLEYFPGSTVVPFAPETTAAMGAQGNRALQGSPLLGGAQDYTGDVLSGQYLDPASNPFLANVSDAVMSAIRPGVDSMFAGGGRAGSPLHAEALGRGVSRGIAPYLFNEYGRERGMMEGAATRAPGLAREDYYDIDRLGDVGAMREGKAQEELQDAISRWNFAQAEPGQRIQQFMDLIRGNYGGTTISTGATPNRMGSMAGGALSGASSGAMLGSVVPGIGTGIGALGGAGLGAAGGK